MTNCQKLPDCGYLLRDISLMPVFFFVMFIHGGISLCLPRKRTSTFCMLIKGDRHSLLLYLGTMAPVSPVCVIYTQRYIVWSLKKSPVHDYMVYGYYICGSLYNRIWCMDTIYAGVCITEVGLVLAVRKWMFTRWQHACTFILKNLTGGVAIVTVAADIRTRTWKDIKTKPNGNIKPMKIINKWNFINKEMR